jgi:hypothetical protein
LGVDEARAKRGFVFVRILWQPLTKIPSLASYGEIGFHQPSIRSSTTGHDSLFELPSRLPGESGRSTILSMDFGPLWKSPGDHAYEPAALGCLASRSFQHSRTANSRAITTLATALPRRNLNLSEDFHFGILAPFQCKPNRFREGCLFMLSTPSDSGGPGKVQLSLLRVRKNPEVPDFKRFLIHLSIPVLPSACLLPRRRAIAPNSRRVRWLSANSSQ